jgi:O-antigen ligase
MNIPLKQKLFYFFPALFCFCLPFGLRIAALLIALWVVVSFFNLQTQPFRKGLKALPLQLMLLFFCLTLVSAIFSSNGTEALFSIEIKLSFLFFPYLLFCFQWPVEILKRCVVSFVSGCFFACVYLILRAFYYSINGQPEYFFYTLFSDMIHSSYFAMYLLLAITIVVLFYRQWFSTQKSVLISSYFFIAVFVVTIFLCSSKLGIISFFICMPLLLFYKWRNRLNFKYVGIGVAGLVLLLFISVKLLPGSFQRLNSLTSLPEQIDKTSTESTAVRVLIWKEALQLVRENFLWGTGAGDDNDALYAAYQQQGLTGALSHKLNAHNQYLQTFIGLGVFGFLLLVLMTLGQMILAVIRKNFLLFVFSLLVMLNFLVESMLQTSAGVLFFAFFYCVFNLVDEEKLLSD